MRLDAATATLLADLAAGAIHREYPNKLSHLLRGDGDVAAPRALTPVFFGSFDWHSAVHCHWALVRLVRHFPSAAWAAHVRSLLAASFTPERIAGEVAYLAPRPSFEVPYGLAWLLQLDAELAEAAAIPPGWRRDLAPLVDLAHRRLADWVGKLTHPIRSGEHSQSAFAMGLALDAARATGRLAQADALAARAVELYRADVAAPVAYEPSAHDFLSPSLAEADLLRRVLPAAELGAWWDAFLPRLDGFRPVTPADRSDGKLVHFDGLNLSRAWMMRGIASGLAADHAARAPLVRLAAEHERAGLEGVSAEHYAGAHWLASFALYALSDRGLSPGGAAEILAP